MSNLDRIINLTEFVIADNPIETTVFVPFTRAYMAADFLIMFGQIDLGDCRKVELIFYNDTNDIELQRILEGWLRQYAGQFGAAKLYMSWNQPLPEFGSQELIELRRDRIITMRKKSQELVGNSKYFFSVEDDTFVNPDAFTRLKRHLDSYPDVLQASGVEVGRWADHCIGAWQITPLNNPRTVESVPYKESGLQEVDGTGMYCYVTYTNMHKIADFHREADCLGPDVCYGLDLRRQDYKVLLDWSVQCEHRSPQWNLVPKDAITIRFDRHEDVWIKAVK
jgi:hypothetical protein